MNNFFEIVVIGASAGGFSVFENILPKIASNFHLPIAIVQHSAKGSGNYLIKHFNEICHLPVKEVDDKDSITGKTIFFAPSDYHLLIEEEKEFSLSVDEKVNFSRPSIDVLFESAARVYKDKTLCIVLTGANSDGTLGAKKIKSLGGFVVVQDPKTAEANVMPNSVIQNNIHNKIMSPEEISFFLNSLVKFNNPDIIKENKYEDK